MPGLRLRRIQRMSACWTRHTVVPGFWFDTMAMTGKLGFVQPGSVIPGDWPPFIASEYSTGHSVAVVDGRLFHGEGLGPNEHYQDGLGHGYRA